MLIPLVPRILNVDCSRNGLQFADSVDWIGFRVCRGLPVEIRDFELQASLPRSDPNLLTGKQLPIGDSVHRGLQFS